MPLWSPHHYCSVMINGICHDCDPGTNLRKLHKQELKTSDHKTHIVPSECSDCDFAVPEDHLKNAFVAADFIWGLIRPTNASSTPTSPLDEADSSEVYDFDDDDDDDDAQSSRMVTS